MRLFRVSLACPSLAIGSLSFVDFPDSHRRKKEGGRIRVLRIPDQHWDKKKEDSFLLWSSVCFEGRQEEEGNEECRPPICLI